MTIFVKNMVCDRCIMMVQSELSKIEITPVSIELGKIFLSEKLSELQFAAFANSIKKLGFEIINEKDLKVVEQVHITLLSLLEFQNSNKKIKLSEILPSKINLSYSSISKTFIKYEKITIEECFINLKIKRVKDLLKVGNLSLNEIAYQLNYSSTSHLSSQFKKITGISTTEFKKNNNRNFYL